MARPRTPIQQLDFVAENRPAKTRRSANLHFELPLKTLRLMGNELPSGVNVLVVPPDYVPPEFVRLPDDGEEERCPVTGMSRAWLRARITDSQGSKAPIKTHYIRTRGATRGVVLIDRDSLVAHIESFPPPGWAEPKEEDSPAGEGKKTPSSQQPP